MIKEIDLHKNRFTVLKYIFLIMRYNSFVYKPFVWHYSWYINSITRKYFYLLRSKNATPSKIYNTIP